MKDFADCCLLEGITSSRFNRCPAGTARAGKINLLYAKVEQLSKCRRTNAMSHLFYHNSHRALLNEPLQCCRESSPLGVSAWLQRFLQGIKMHDQGIGLSYFDALQGVRNTVFSPHLRATKIGENRNARRDMTQLEGAPL